MRARGGSPLRSNRVKRFLGLAVAACVSATTITACSGSTSSPQPTPSESVPAALTDRNADGAALANAWFELLASTGTGSGESVSSQEQLTADSARMQPYLDGAFQLQRASGQRFTKQNYTPVDIDDYEISNVVETQPRNDVKVVRYAASTPGAIAVDEGMVMSGELGPRLTVLHWDEGAGHWTIVSHANYNVPTAAICDREPITVTHELVNDDPEVRKLGESLVSQWRDITTGKAQQNVLAKESQIQLADGQGWPNPDGTPIKWTPAKSYESKELVTTRNGDLLVASYDAVVPDIVMEGEEYRGTVSPRLLTYLRDPDGKWEMIALANFTVPRKVPANVDCGSQRAPDDPAAPSPTK